MKQFISTLAVGLLSVAAFALPAGVAKAADYPSKTIRIVVPVPPGGPTDTAARIVAERLNALWGQPVIVENKPGGTGALANQTVNNANPDGYTILVGNVSTNAITFATDPEKTKGIKLKGVTNLIQVPGILSANGDLPVTSIQDLVAKMKSGELKNIKYGSGGVGTYPQIDMLRLMTVNGLDATHIAYKGAGQILPALLGNEIQLEFLNEASGLPLIRSGRLKGLATTWTERLPELPDVPTMQELGYGDIGTSAWHGMFVPEKTPPEVVNKLYSAVAGIMNDADVQKKLADQYIKATPSKSPEDFSSFVDAERAKWLKIIQDNHIEVAP
ncbi:tripartite tricarboxylate transporter substrate binding protein [Ancylobacter sonchi]|uniref:Bug family tripartite tricarboxylate transporter substrate binding protein n=1 Tax=Ancylobacter sonchi TaxID=1937790 RepID=UPI001BD56599|nr:tripartite tricarboxylate transporter substrate binding protein [Ancylobacter sonchi]MBS7532469.1 tripartite tricarboxylate transporter substrate binding protein [Ancylobacter sonchi]